MKHIRGLDGLRGLMAVWVVIGHTLGAFPNLFRGVPNSLHNDVPVQVFIILSGFVIFAMLDRQYESYRRYLVGRAFRIFPIYLFVLVLSTLTLNFAEQMLRASPIGVATTGRIQIIEIAKSDLTMHFLAHLPLLQGVFPNSVFPSASFTIIGQAWSLTLEWQFYLVAPFIFAMLTRLWKGWVALVAVFIVAFCWLISPIMNAAFIGNGIPLFAIGFLSFFAFKHSFFEKHTHHRHALFIASILLVSLLLREIAAAVIIWLIALFSVTSLSNDSCFFAIRTLLSSRFFAYFGNISYPLYMIHMQAFFGCLWVTNHLALPEAYRLVVLPALVLVTSIGASDLLHRLIELPCQNIGRRLSQTL